MLRRDRRLRTREPGASIRAPQGVRGAGGAQAVPKLGLQAGGSELAARVRRGTRLKRCTAVHAQIQYGGVGDWKDRLVQSILQNGAGGELTTLLSLSPMGMLPTALAGVLSTLRGTGYDWVVRHFMSDAFREKFGIRVLAYSVQVGTALSDHNRDKLQGPGANRRRGRAPSASPPCGRGWGCLYFTLSFAVTYTNSW